MSLGDKILNPDLHVTEKVMLAQVVAMPGWKVVMKMAEAACNKATKDTIAVKQEDEDYERIVVERQRRARNIFEFSDLLFESILEHARSIKRIEQKEDEQAVEAVAAMYGIHPAKPKKDGPAGAIERTFGIHPARPKKSPAKGKQ